MGDASVFLNELYPKPNEEAFLVACSLGDNNRFRSIWKGSTLDLDELADVATETGTYRDVWVNICALGGLPGGNSRGKENQVRFIPGVWADIDLKYVSDPLRSLKSLGVMRPTMAVWSGHGVHAYWLYDTGPVDIDSLIPDNLESNEEKLEHLRSFQSGAKAQAIRWVEWLKQQLDCQLDSVGDLARVLRVPGTNNFKDPADIRTVHIAWADGERFNPFEIQETLNRGNILIPQVGVAQGLTKEQATAAFARQGRLEGSPELERVLAKWEPRLLEWVNGRKYKNSRDASAWEWAMQMSALGVPRDVAEEIGYNALPAMSTLDSEGLEDPLTEAWWRAKLDSAYGNPPRDVPLGPLGRLEERSNSRPNGSQNVLDDGIGGSGSVPPSNGAVPSSDDSEPPIGPPSGPVTGSPPPPRQVSDPLADAALRDHFAVMEGQNIRFTPATGFLVWERGTWEFDGKECPRVREKYEGAADDYRARLMMENAGDEALINEIRRTSRSWLSNTRTKQVIEQLQQRTWAEYSLLNSHDDKINCPNGVVDLRTGELIPHDRDLLFTHKTVAPYIPWDDLEPAERDRFMTFMHTVTRDSVPFMEGLQRAAGYTLTGSTAEDKLFLVWGVKRSGKSTLVDGMLDVLGRGGFSEQVKPEILMSSFKTRGNVDDAVAQASRARMIATFEPERGEKFAEGLLKTATGGEAMTAKALYKSTFTFRPKWKIWMASNVKPGSMDPAVHERLVFFPFTRSMVGQEDRTLRPWMRDPRSGGAVLLSWMVNGAVEYYRSGLRLEDIPEHMETLGLYRDEEDLISGFIKDWFEPSNDRNESVRVMDGVHYFQMWCMQQGEKPMSKRAFGSAMEERGFFKGRNGAGQIIFVGLKLKQTSESDISQLQNETW